jgi:cytochrome c peroxidase
MRMRAIVIAVLLAAALGSCSSSEPSGPAWTADELKLISSMSLSSLPPLPPDPSNAVADDPAAALLGEALFFDVRLSSNGQVSCASCHLPEHQFQDDLALAKGVGKTTRRTMPIAGTAYSPWLFWDGRKDSQWSQALGPLESPVEHGSDRTQIARLVATYYANDYAAVFGSVPDVSTLPEHAMPAGDEAMIAAWAGLSEEKRDEINTVFANVGKAIAAFERTIAPQKTRFDDYADTLVVAGDPTAILSSEEIDGLRLFLGKGECTKCHNGPLLTDNYFHNTGVPAVGGLPADDGRVAATAKVLDDPFNCLGDYSDADPTDCAELRFMTVEGEEMVRAYKPPSLRGVVSRPPYMHAGQFATLAQVLEHYNSAPEAPKGHSELEPLALTSEEMAALAAFLETLDAPSATGDGS